LLNEWFGYGRYQIGRQNPQYVQLFRKIPDARSSKRDDRSSDDTGDHHSARPVDQERPGRSGRHIKHRELAIIQFGAGARKTTVSDRNRQSSK